MQIESTMQLLWHGNIATLCGLLTTDGENLSPRRRFDRPGGAFRNSRKSGALRTSPGDRRSGAAGTEEHKDSPSDTADADRCVSVPEKSALREGDRPEQKDELQKEYLKQNTAKMRLKEQQAKSGDTAQGYREDPCGGK